MIPPSTLVTLTIFGGLLSAYAIYTKSYFEYVGEVNMLGLVHVVSRIDPKPDEIKFISKAVNPQNSEVIASGVSSVKGCNYLDARNWDCRTVSIEGLLMVDGTLSRRNPYESWEYERFLVLPWNTRIRY
jgi:hypothetical protein